VRIDISALDLDDGAARAGEYATLMPLTPKEREGQNRLQVVAGADAAAITQEAAGVVGAFKDAIKNAYGADFEELRFIQAFHHAAKGLADRPVHYPRPGLGPRVGPDPAGKNFEWFVANNHKNGLGVALDALWEPRGLPYQDKRR